MLQRFNIHDETLYTNFVHEITSTLNKYSEDDLLKKLQQICITQHPITNSPIDRTFELLDVIDFHYGLSEAIQMDWKCREKLAKIILDQISQDPQLVLGMDQGQKQFKAVYPNLFRTSERAKNEAGFYDRVLNVILHSLE